MVPCVDGDLALFGTSRHDDSLASVRVSLGTHVRLSEKFKHDPERVQCRTSR